jgi:hypothetical protein
MNPSTGMFISQDAYQGSVYDPVSLHKYLYASANPVMYSDPSGYMFFVVGNVVREMHETSKEIVLYTNIYNSLTSLIFSLATTMAAGYALVEAIMEISLIAAVVNGNYSQQTADYLLNEIFKGATGQQFDFEGIFYVYAQHIKEKVGDRVSDKTHNHHIVAKKAYKADLARTLLKRAGLDVNITENQVQLKQRFHARLHTNLYYQLVNASVGLAYDTHQSFEDKKEKAKRIKYTLKAIGFILSSASEACP